MLGLTKLEKKTKLYEKMEKLKEQKMKLDIEIENLDKEIKSTTFNKYMISKIKTRFDVVKIIGLCKYENKPGFSLFSLYESEGEIKSEPYSWFQTSVERDYDIVTKEQAQYYVKQKIDELNNIRNKRIKEFFESD